MSRVAGILTALATALAGAALAQSDAGVPPSVACEVAGYDVVIRNTGETPMAVGTSVAWAVRFARREGTHTLAAPLQPGSAVFVSAALGSTYLGPDTPCTASIG